MFCHGALCMAISGKCYLSLQNANRSANRGECVQICRRGYKAEVLPSYEEQNVDKDDAQRYLITDLESGTELEVDNKYIMSPKDLKTIRFIDRMMRSGVRVFKIEGRARGPEYVKTVVSCYREAFEAIADGTYGEEKIAEWDERLSTVFNRGFWNGYYLGQRLGEWSHIYGSKATEKKFYAAKTMGWYSRIGIGDFQCEAEELHKGDKILIIGPTTGVVEVVLDEIQVDYKVVDTVHKGERFTIPVKEKIRPSDKLFVIKYC